MSVYNLVTHVADQTFLITITNINMSSLARCISSFRLQSIFYWAAHYVRHLSLLVRVICLSLVQPQHNTRDLRVESCLLSVRGHFLSFFFLSFFLHHPTTRSHTCRNLLKMGCRNVSQWKFFPFVRMSWGYLEIINGFWVHDNIDFFSPATFLMDLLSNFFFSVIPFSLSLMTQTDDMVQNSVGDSKYKSTGGAI